MLEELKKLFQILEFEYEHKTDTYNKNNLFFTITKGSSGRKISINITNMDNINIYLDIEDTIKYIQKEYCYILRNIKIKKLLNNEC